MIEITNEKMEKLYKMQTTLVKSYTTISAIVIFVVLVITRLLRAVSSGDHAALSAVFMIILAADVVGYFIIRKKVIPAGNGPSVMDEYKTMQNDFISDRTVDLLYRKIGEAGNYADKTKLTLLLCDTYMMRGQINEAISLLNSIDRSRFAEYPEAGMSFYDDTLSLYDLIGDNESVMRAYEDAVPFIEHCYEKNYLCCSTALNIVILNEKARGNYRKALDLKLMKNEFENKVNTFIKSEAVNSTKPLNRYIHGVVFCDTAELFYLCGDYFNAGKYLDIGGPMLAASPYMTEKANELSQKIKAALNSQA